MGAPVPILQSALVVCKSVQELVEVLTQLDEYQETFFQMICIVLQEFHHSIDDSLKQLIRDDCEEQGSPKIQAWIDLEITNLFQVKIFGLLLPKNFSIQNLL